MSFLKQILNPFIEFDEDKKKEKAKAPLSTSQIPPTPASSPEEKSEHPLITGHKQVKDPSIPIPAYSPSGVMTTPLPEHEQYFERLIDEANRNNPFLQGSDYKEFIDSKMDIDDITDEALKYRTALNILKSSGLTKEKLLSTGQEYIDLIGRDLNAFQSAQAHQYQNDIGQKEKVIQTKAEELQALTKKIQALKAEINQLTQEINLTREKFDTTRNSFLLAGEKKQKEIQAELEKIARYF
jgi:hypothetical protein